MVYALVGGMGSQAEPVWGIAGVDLSGTRTRLVGTTAPEAANCMYLASSIDGGTLYATHALDEGEVSAWALAGMELSQIGGPRFSGGGTPCHIVAHPAGRHVLTANYATGTVAVHPINEDGSLADPSHVIHHVGHGPESPRQDGPHPHMVLCDPDVAPGRGDVLVADLGTDSVHRYRLDTHSGRLVEMERVAMPPGTGPRHLVVRGRHAYVAGELDSTVTVVDLAAAPSAVRVTVPTRMRPEPERSHPSAIRMSDDGRFLYVLNRGADTIATLSASGADVRLVAEVECGGEQPWDAVIDNGSLYVACRRSDAIIVLRIDARTGVPEQTGHSVPVPGAVCITAVGK